VPIVDDDPLIRERLEALVAAAGFEVRTVFIAARRPAATS
jgi:FixJ family two-component response regulator